MEEFELLARVLAPGIEVTDATAEAHAGARADGAACLAETTDRSIIAALTSHHPRMTSLRTSRQGRATA